MPTTFEGLIVPDADYKLEFAIRYDEPICDACGSMLITHSFADRGWKFWCSMCRTPVYRLTVTLLDRRGSCGKRVRVEILIDDGRSQDRDSGGCDDSGAGID